MLGESGAPSLMVAELVEMVVVTGLGGRRATGRGGVWSHVLTGWPPMPWTKMTLCTIQGKQKY